MAQDELGNRVQALESNHTSFVSEFRQTNETLRKIEMAIEKQNEISTDIRIFRQEFKGQVEMYTESNKRQNARIEKLENAQSRVGWMIVMAVIAALLTLVLKGH